MDFNSILDSGLEFAGNLLKNDNTQPAKPVTTAAPAAKTNYTPWIIGGVLAVLGLGALVVLRK